MAGDKISTLDLMIEVNRKKNVFFPYINHTINQQRSYPGEFSSDVHITRQLVLHILVFNFR